MFRFGNFFIFEGRKECIRRDKEDNLAVHIIMFFADKFIPNMPLKITTYKQFNILFLAIPQHVLRYDREAVQ